MSISMNDQPAVSAVNPVQPSINFKNEVAFGELFKDIMNYVAEYTDTDKNITNDTVALVVESVTSVRTYMTMENHILLHTDTSPNKFFKPRVRPMIVLDTDATVADVEVADAQNGFEFSLGAATGIKPTVTSIPLSGYRYFRDSQAILGNRYTAPLVVAEVADCFIVSSDERNEVHTVRVSTMEMLFKAAASASVILNNSNISAGGGAGLMRNPVPQAGGVLGELTTRDRFADIPQTPQRHQRNF